MPAGAAAITGSTGQDWTAARPHHRHRIPARSDLPPAQSRQPAGVDERQRQSSAARRREDISEGGKGTAVAESGHLFRHRKTRRLTGESGVKMTGPYEYVAPSYWLTIPTHAS